MKEKRNVWDSAVIGIVRNVYNWLSHGIFQRTSEMP